MSEISKVPPENHTILITGGAGFIGSHLADLLIRHGHRVYAVDDLSTGKQSNIQHLIKNPGFSFIRADIMDEIVMDRLCSEVDIIIHLAAAVGVQLIVNNPVHTIETNIKGTEAVLKSALKYNCRVLIASTSEVYGKGYKLPFNEKDDVLLGCTDKNRWAYAASKMVDEFLGMAYFNEYGLEVFSTRFFNTVGPRQTGRYGMVIPRFVRQALKNQPITVYGDGQQQRCFCDVRDVVKAVELLALNDGAVGKVFNIGGDEEISIIDLAEKVKTLTNSRSEIVKIPYDQAYAPGFEDMLRRVPDIGRVNQLIGWKSGISLEETLRSVIEFESRKSH
ncbi:MAG: NAD-dependent epimerase/dehydratase family protein [FCB group bacterium]|nr:NAD-dependent epimerase/dehydratase family protein [FCB group bacterium]